MSIDLVYNILENIAELAGEPPGIENGSGELLAHCYNIFEQVDRLADATGDMEDDQ